MTREAALKTHRLSLAQWKALDKFTQPGGHGHGEYAYLPTPTAKVLERRGLVTLGRKSPLRGHSFPHGEATAAGRDMLNAIRAAERVS